ncbi:lysophospholipid acyltransferase family protein [Salinarimonas rosea]|uniref:lysophospholipid acyltransferase family protein n=1 Tax=Salinarimonas rosea TaxID=552063 RepID=UPI0003F64675|nr:lysophospholipid acyltransferase family protein [Salinarimonas rosea]
MAGLLKALRLLVLVLALVVLIGPQAIGVRAHWAIARRIPVLFHRIALWALGVRVGEIGHPPKETPTLVLANHVSWLDIVVLGSLRPLSFVAKSEIAGWPLFGTLARLQRSIFIERERKAATAEVNATIARRLARGELIVLFAEGTTGDGGRILPFRTSLVGAARLALADHRLDAIALQPLSLVYVRRDGLPLDRRERPEIAWYGDMDLVPHLKGVVAGGPIDVEIRWGAPIPFDAQTDRKRAAARAEDEVRRGLNAGLGRCGEPPAPHPTR